MSNLTGSSENVTHRGYIYLLESLGFYKIGVTENLNLRISTIKSSTPHNVVIVDFFPSYLPYQDEHHLHQMWKEFRVKGEWFSIPQHEIKNRKTWFRTIVSLQDAEQLKESQATDFATKVLMAFNFFSWDHCKSFLNVKSDVELRELISASEEILDPVLAYERGIIRTYEAYLREGNTHEESVAKVRLLIGNAN